MATRLLLLAACVCAVGITAFAQVPIQPDSAQVLLYFPHLADGGPPSQQWQTTFKLVNPNQFSVNVTLKLYDDGGRPLSLDFGTGPSSQITASLPALGSRVFRSKIVSQNTVTGWARGFASSPIQATVAFREIENGKPTIEVTADATLPSLAYVSAANSQLGIAIANVYSDTPVSVAINVVDSEGRRIGNQVTTIPAFGHTSFPLYAKFPNLPPDFAGSVVLTGVSAPNDIFVAWTANSDSGVISSLPSGRAAMPVSQWDRVWLVFQKLVNSPAGRLLLGPDPVTLDISYDRIINAKGGNNSVVIYLALAELIDDSESELGFVVAHELGHVYQGRVQRLDFNPNLEWDADVFGLLVSTLAGYDPYAAAGALAKLAMATGQAGLITQFESQLSTDAHKSFNQRLENIYTTIQQVCSYSADTKAACQAYKNVMHPDFPSSAPLSIPRSPEREIR